MPVLPSYRNQSVDLLANQLTGFYMRATLALNGLKKFLHLKENEYIAHIK